MLRFGSMCAASLVLAAACGGRSSLNDGAGSTASGGSGGSTSSASTSATPTNSVTSTSSSGVAGAPPLCGALTLTGAPITHDSIPAHAFQPALVPATNGGDRVSVVFAKQAPEGPTVPPVRASNVTFTPWGDWPSSLGLDNTFLAFGGDSIAVAPALPAAQPGFAALFYLPTSAFPSDMALAGGVAPDATYDPFPPVAQWDAWEPASPVALARGAARHLAAYQIAVGDNRYLTLAPAPPSPDGSEIFGDVACADGPFPAALAPAKGGFLVAAASGRTFGSCPDDNGIPGPPVEIQVSRFEEDTTSLSLEMSYSGDDPVARLALATGGDDAWLVFQGSGANAFAPPPIRATRLDPTGAQGGPIFDIEGSEATSLPFAAASLGPLLAVAWIDAIDPSAPTLMIQLFDANGNLVTGTSHNTAPSWLYQSSLSLLASPDGRHLLLSWADYDASPTGIAAVKVARFSCVTPL